MASMRRLPPAFAALVALLVLLLGVPVFLAVTVGLPFVHGGLPSWSQVGTVLSTRGLPDYVLIGVLGIVGWLVWLDFAVSIVLEVAAAMRRQSAPRVPVVRWLQPLAAYLVATILLAFVASARSGSATATRPLGEFLASAPRVTHVVSMPVQDTHSLLDAEKPAAATPAAGTPTTTSSAELAAASPTTSYVVRDGDTLWSIANERLGDPTKWTQIRDLNLGRTMSDGRTFDNPSLLRPGWTLALPSQPVPPEQKAARASVQPTEPAPVTYEVHGGDSLWSIAGDKLGDPTRWTEIRDLNLGRTMPDGRTFDNPSLLRPGWTLILPAQATPAAQTAAPVAPPAVAAPTAPSAAPPDQTSAPQQPAAPPTQAPAANAPAGPGLGAVMDPPATGTTSVHPAPPPSAQHPGENAERPAQASRVDLPLGGVVGVSLATAVAGLVAAARLHARRRQLPGDVSFVARVNRLSTDTIRSLLRADRARQATEITPPPAEDPAPLGTLEVGEVRGQRVRRELASLSGLGLAGPGAEDVARALAVAFLAHAPAARTRLLLTEASAALLPGVAAVPGVSVVATVEEALTRLDHDVVGRSQLLDAHHAADFSAFLDADPGEPLPFMLLLTGLPHQQHRRVDATVGLGRRLGLALVVLGSSPSGETVVVGTDGKVTVESVGGVLEPLVGGHLDRINAHEAADVIACVAAGRGVAPADDGVPAPQLQELETELAPLAARPAETRPVRVTVMGPLDVRAGGHPVRWGRRKAAELLALLVLHRNGADRDWLAEQLWPEMALDKARQSFYTTEGHCREVLRAATGLTVEKFILASGAKHQLDARLVDVDLWRFEAAKLEARTADPEERHRALERAAAACGRDELLAGEAYEGVEILREHIRGQAVEALCDLAKMRQNSGELEAAADAYEQALCHDQFQEALYRRIIGIEVERHRPDAARRWGRVLEAHLAELNEEPDEETVQLLRQVRGVA